MQLDQFFLMLRGDLSIYLYDFMHDLLSLPAASIDLVKVQSLFQEAVFHAFPPNSASAQRFVESLSVEKRKGGGNEKGWDVIEISVNLNYPLNIIISNSILQKYKKLFHQLLLLNVCVFFISFDIFLACKSLSRHNVEYFKSTQNKIYAGHSIGRTNFTQ